MNIHDWALITFTILAQMSVGSFIVLGAVHFYSTKKAGAEEADKLSDRALLAIFVVLALGFVASLFHLGNPFNAYRAVTNFGSSWLSREITSGVAFAVVGGLFALMQWRKIASFQARNIIAWIAAVIGVVLVISMSQVYMIRTQPAWNTLATPVMFLATTGLLGSLAVGVALVASVSKKGASDVQKELMRDALRWVSIASVFALGVEVIAIAVRLAILATGGEAAVASMAMLMDPYGAMFIIQLLFVFVGGGVFSVFIYQNAQSAGKEKVLSSLAYGAFALVLIAEVLGRFLFYAAHVMISI